MILPGIKLITFDATNTLMKYRVPPWDYYAIVAEKHGFKVDGKQVKQDFKKNYKELMKHHPNFGKQSIKWENWWDEIIKQTFQDKLPISSINKISKQLIEDFTSTKCFLKANGCDQLLELLSKNGIALGVISNFDPRLHKILNNLNIDNCFEFILTSYEMGFSKPDKQLFKIAQEKINGVTCGSQCLHIGDDFIKDYEGAVKAGWNAVLITKETDFKEPYTCVKIFKNLLDLHNAIESHKLCFA